MREFALIFFLVLAASLSAQQSISGKVTDEEGSPFELDVQVKAFQNGEFIKGDATNKRGKYELKNLPTGNIKLVFEGLGLAAKEFDVTLSSGEKLKDFDIKLEPTDLDVIEVIDDPNTGIGDGEIKTDIEKLEFIPGITGTVEELISKVGIGVRSSSDELSSQYTVRGGNFDENLVYVNDFEVYRPQLVRSGQQEGLTFPNVDLISDLSFSAGGFQAKYGDKMSSVLDVRYKRPTDTRASVSMSLLGGSAHVEGSILQNEDNDDKQTKAFRYLFGARYKTTNYLLGTLDTRGEYQTNFADVQTYLTYDLNPNWQVGLLANYSRSLFSFEPLSRQSTLGLINFAIQFNTEFEGQEISDFENYMGGLSLTHVNKRGDFYLKFLASSYRSVEAERFDITGFYLLGQVETSLGSDNFGEIVSVLGNGTQQRYARNQFEGTTSNFAVKGGKTFTNSQADSLGNRNQHQLEWGARYQYEFIADKLNEWERLDSAGYSLPFDTEQVLINEVLKSQNTLRSSRMTAFVQDTWTIEDSRKELNISAGVRAGYWTLNEELFTSPRAQILYKPIRYKGETEDGEPIKKDNLTFKFASGLYYQPPYYREMRRIDGSVNTALKSQKSLHGVFGLTWDFKLGKKQNIPMKFIAEAYYKRLWDIVSYDFENVRIRYSGENDADGYVVGLDLRLNGEFVPGADSWLNISLLQARERLDGVQHQVVNVGDITNPQNVEYVPRPTDEAMFFNLFFQDYLPQNTNFKTHVSISVGTGLPFGQWRNNDVFRNTYRYAAYHRVDIGFSALLWNKERFKKRSAGKHPLGFSRNIWASLEVFNLLDVRNEASVTWVKTFTNQQFAISNFLSGRRVNLRIKMDF